MRIKTKEWQHRRDFHAVYQCEHCGVLTTSEPSGRPDNGTANGYDDAYFHQHVIPNWECPSCGKSSDGVASSSPSVPAGVEL